jgi:polynucleotide 5'-hydroxyl-kinase GRC3/NOL9
MEPQSIVVHGLARLEVLAGTITTCGAILFSSNETHSLACPATHPLPSISPVVSTSSHPTSSHPSLSYSAKQPFSAIVRLSSISGTGIEGLASLASRGGLVSLRFNMVPKPFGPATDLARSKSFEIVLSSTPNLFLLRTPAAWDRRLGTLAIGTVENSSKSVTVQIQGPKNVGKSVLGRLCLNRLLSCQSPTTADTPKKVAWLETDVGQPEFGPPGFVSLFVFDQPQLGGCPHPASETRRGQEKKF